MTENSMDLVQGTLDVLILRTLAWEPMHGYGISKWIRDRTSGVLDVGEAALYQALRRMHRKGWVEAEWGLSENNRRAKYYTITAAGQRQLKAELRGWKRYATAVSTVLEPLPGGSR